MTEIVNIPLVAIVDHPDQPRYSAGDVRALADSIAAAGQLEPVILANAGGSTYTAITGHRRIAALRLLNRQTASAIVVEGTDRIQQVRALMISNTARQNLTPVEEARGYQTMLELGMDVKAVAKASGRETKRVAALAAAGQSLTSDQALQLHDHQVTVEEMLALAELAADEKRYEQLVKEIGKPRFAQQAEWLKEEAARDLWEAEVREQLAAEGTRIAENGGMWQGIDYLADEDGNRLTPETHASCPGHAARIDRWDREVRYVCTAGKHPHFSKGQPAYQETPEQIAEREAEQKRRAQLQVAAEVRKVFVKDLLSGRKPQKALTDWAWQEWLRNEDWAREELKEKFGLTLSELSPLAAIAATLVIDCESDPSYVRVDPDYMLMLMAAGYEPSDVERELNKPAEKTEDPSPICGAQSCAGCEETTCPGDPEAYDPTSYAEDEDPENIAEVQRENARIAEEDEAYYAEEPTPDTITVNELAAEFCALVEVMAEQPDAPSADQEARYNALHDELERRGVDTSDAAALAVLAGEAVTA